MRNIEVCKNCKYCHVDKIYNNKYVWNTYQCKMHSGIGHQGFMVDVIGHTARQFEELPLYKGCPYYMEHIVMKQELECKKQMFVKKQETD